MWQLAQPLLAVATQQTPHMCIMHWCKQPSHVHTPIMVLQIMITAGDEIDAAFGAKLGLSSMAAAGLGNTIADVVGINISHSIEVGCPNALRQHQHRLQANRIAWPFFSSVVFGCNPRRVLMHGILPASAWCCRMQYFPAWPPIPLVRSGLNLHSNTSGRSSGWPRPSPRHNGP